MMKLGLGLYKSLLNDTNFKFARQAGATHIVAQLVDYVKGDRSPSLTRDYLNGWGETRNEHIPWKLDDLIALRRRVESHGLTLEALENFDPSHWYDILLDGPNKKQQMERLKQTVRDVGKAGIPIMGYYFSLAGVWGWSVREAGRGNPVTVGFDAAKVDVQHPIPDGMVWNMNYRRISEEKTVPKTTVEEMWDRLDYFLQEIIPVAEECGVRLVAHPDDPPLDTMRQTGRLFCTFAQYEKLIDRYPSPANGMEFCLGTLQEMVDGDIYDFVEKHALSGNIGYIHFRNVKGKVPEYREVFVDEGDMDMVRVLRILKRCNYQGVMIPDHTPEMSCPGPWHTGMAFALGYMKGVLQAIENE